VTRAGHSGTPLQKKLGVKDGMTALFAGLTEEIEPLAGVEGWRKAKRARSAKGAASPCDYLHIFTAKRADYAAAIPQPKKALAPEGMIWASWPKKSSSVPCDLTDADIRSHGLKAGLVDIKVRAVDEMWSGLKFVTPVKDRMK
jgi:hypothetical protein